MLAEVADQNLLASREILLATRKSVLVVRVTGMMLQTGLIEDLCVGAICYAGYEGEVPCEVVGFDQQHCYFMALRPLTNVGPGTPVHLPASASRHSPPEVANKMLGRVLDGLGSPLDGSHPVAPGVVDFGDFPAINPLQRMPIEEPLDTGIAAINGLLTVGVGQRVGIFAGSGVGKSVLLGMLARFVKADVVVIGLIGERGREVQEFVEDNLGDALRHSVVIASPADDSPALRLRASRLATQVAESFRAQGQKVLLLFDSLTRVAQAQREIGLAMGEPATSKGYPPSAFALLPRLVERAGCESRGKTGAISAFYTVLAEEDDLQDPVVDASRAILDGHIVLNRRLSEMGIYPAIDVAQSVSRLMQRLSTAEQQSQVRRFRQLWQTYSEQQDLINVGAYRPGSDPVIDDAVRYHSDMCEFLRQRSDECVSLVDADLQVQNLFTAPPIEPQGAIPRLEPAP